MEVLVSCSPSVNKESESVVIIHLKLLLKLENLDESNSNMWGMKRVGFKVLSEQLELKRNMIQWKDSSFTIINIKEKQKIHSVKKLEWVNVWHFCLKNDWNIWSAIKKSGK